MGERLVLAAHGVAPAVYRNAAARKLFTIDATCPLVKKVHVEVRRFADAGYCVILIGHAGHEEVVGTAGEAPGVVMLVETLEQARTVAVPNPELVAYVTQTTLSIDETKDIVAALRARFLVSRARRDRHRAVRCAQRRRLVQAPSRVE